MKKEFLWNQVQEEEVSSLELVVGFGICQKKRESFVIWAVEVRKRERALVFEIGVYKRVREGSKQDFCVYPWKRKQEEPRLQEKPKL